MSWRDGADGSRGVTALAERPGSVPHPGPGTDPAAAAPRPLRVALADDDAEMRRFLTEVLARLGHAVVAAAADGRELIEQCRAAAPDLVITDILMPGADGLEAAASLGRERPVPVVLLTAHPEADFLGRAEAGHVMACLTKPVKAADLQAAIALAVLRFEHFQQLRQEAAGLRQALEDRKVIERAKGILMNRLEVDENEAFRRLRKLASNQNRKLLEVAETVIAAEEVLLNLSRV